MRFTGGDSRAGRWSQAHVAHTRTTQARQADARKHAHLLARLFSRHCQHLHHSKRTLPANAKQNDIGYRHQRDSCTMCLSCTPANVELSRDLCPFNRAMGLMASNGQASTHRPQATQVAVSMVTSGFTSSSESSTEGQPTL